MNATPRFRVPHLIRSVLLLLVAAAASCSSRTHEPSAGPSFNALPLGELAGAATLDAGQVLDNPFGHDPAAVAEGHRLYIQMNCAGCHGYAAEGAMGPRLSDISWRYGGTPQAIYQSIQEGRPQGMPAWGKSLPAGQIWKIAAYLQTLGGVIEARSYHEGLQGDHDVTSTAPDALGFDGSPSTVPAP